MHLSTSLGCCAFTFAVSLPAQTNQPNILIIIADDLGTDQVGAYTPTAPPTPNIDRLAATGLRFTNAWANPLCSPTRAVIHTGRHGFRTGVRNIVRPVSAANSLPLHETTLPELFDGPTPSGYGTALIGKWHLDNQHVPGAWGPIAHGWDTFAGILGGSVRHYCEWSRAVATVSSPTPRIQTTFDYATTRTVDDALGWITSRPPASPWLCCVSFPAPHYPLHAPPSHLHTRSLPPGPECRNVGASAPQVFFEAMVEALDTEIGRLLFTLQGLGELANTNIFLLGDNGTSSCQISPPFQPSQGKGSVFQGGVQVPFLVCGPAVQQPGRDVTGMVHVVDLYRTIAELCAVEENIPTNVTIDSQSLLPYLANQNPPVLRLFLLTEIGQFLEPCQNGRPGVFHLGAVAIRDLAGNKLVRWRTPDNPDSILEQLFDLQSDPFEQTPLPLQGFAYASLKDGLLAFGCGGLCR